MEEKEKVNQEEQPEDNVKLTAEEEEAGDIHWKTKPDRNWMPEEGEQAKGEEASVDPAIAEQEEAELRMVLDEARRRAEEVPEEEMHPEYKAMVGIGAVPASDEEKEAEGEKVRLVRCGDCGAMVPFDQLQDNGSFLACPKCY